MSCTGYLPPFQAQLDGSVLGPKSCTCYAGAMAGNYDSCGAKHPTGHQVRVLTGDTIGGTSLQQVDDALRAGYGIDLDTRSGSAALSWARFAAYIDAGRGAILQGGYGPINDSRFQGSETFRGNHAVAVFPGWVVMDPLADGRRPGIYRYHGEAYPQSLLRAFASALVVNPKTGAKAGSHVWCSLTRDNTAVAKPWRAVVHPAVGQTFERFGVYVVVNGVIVGRTMARTQGFSADCTPPRSYRWPALALTKSLVKLTTGSRKGQYINSAYAQEVP